MSKKAATTTTAITMMTRMMINVMSAPSEGVVVVVDCVDVVVGVVVDVVVL